MSLYKKICICAAAILAAATLLTACRADIVNESTTIQNDQTTVADAAYYSTTAAVPGVNNATTYNREETRTGTAITTSTQIEETRTQPTTDAPVSTTSTPVQYKEWTYWSASGYKVTYTENPSNRYITKAAEQLCVPANNLSASYNIKGATVFLFSSSVKSEATLTDCFIIFSEKMIIEENIRKDGSTGSNKALADILYNNAMKKEP